MRAVRVTRTDGPDGTVVQDDVDEPVPAENQVLIDVVAASANFPDLLMSKNLYQYKPEPPFTLGGEIAGVVRAAPAASTLRAGDRVAALSVIGGFADRAVASLDRVFALPDDISFDAAACLPMNYLTMLFALRDRGGLRAGETVLVHGAAGGIGTSTIQLARAMGATVISVVSTPDKADFVRALGSHEVVLAETFRTDVNALTGGRGVDVVVDPVGGHRFTDSLRSLAFGGRLLVLGFATGEIPEVKVNRLLLKNIDVRGVAWNLWTNFHEGAMQAMWRDLLPLLASGAVNPPIRARYALEDAADALRAIEQRKVLGKVVVTVAHDQSVGSSSRNDTSEGFGR